MIREVRRCQQEEKETEAADDGEEDDEEGYDHNRVADEETGEGVGDDDEEEKVKKEFRPPPPPADYGDPEEEEDEEEESISVVVVVDGRNCLPSGDDITPYAPRVRHSVSNVTDPGGFPLDPQSSSVKSSDSERKWKFQMSKRRRSFSADALCEPAHVHHQQRRRQGSKKQTKNFKFPAQ